MIGFILSIFAVFILAILMVVPVIAIMFKDEIMTIWKEYKDEQKRVP